MSRLTIYKDNLTDSTIVSNRFIDEYMKDANDAQIKVYLYLLRMMNSNLPTSISDIVDKFNHTENDVIRALTYWEKRDLLRLDYDEKGEMPHGYKVVGGVPYLFWYGEMMEGPGYQDGPDGNLYHIDYLDHATLINPNGWTKIGSKWIVLDGGWDFNLT